jgi:hypothetical protein
VRVRAPGGAAALEVACPSASSHTPGRMTVRETPAHSGLGAIPQAAAGDDKTCAPPRSATARWRLEVAGREGCAGDQPGDHGVRIPHLARTELVASPHRNRDSRDEVEQPARGSSITGQPRRSADRLGEIRNGPTPPAAELIAKQPQPAEVATPHGTGGNDTSTRLVGVRRRREFDRVAIAGQRDDEHRVIEVASRPMPTRGFDGLEDPPVEANGATPRAEGNPKQIHGGCSRCVHGVSKTRRQAAGWHPDLPAARLRLVRNQSRTQCHAACTSGSSAGRAGVGVIEGPGVVDPARGRRPRLRA